MILTRTLDYTMFFQHIGNGKMIILIVDIVLIGDNLEKIKRIKTNLVVEFEAKDLLQIRYFL